MFNCINFIRIGMKRFLRFGKGSLVTILLFLTASITACGLLAMVDVWQTAASSHLTAEGLNRLTVTSESAEPLDISDVQRIEEQLAGAGQRVVHQVTTMLQLRDAEGNWDSFLATSCVNNDPILGNMAIVSGHLPSSSDHIVVSPETMRRLGYVDVSAWPKTIEARVLGPEKSEKTGVLQIACVVGSLDNFGIRIPLETMTAIRAYQCGVTATISAGNADVLTELNAVHITISSDINIEEVAESLRALDDYQVTSPYFDRSTGRKLMSAAMQFGLPTAVSLIAANCLLILLTSSQQIRNDCEQILWLKLAGAGTGYLFACSVLPRIYVATGASVFGAMIAHILLISGVHRLSCVLDLDFVYESRLMLVIPALAVIATISYAVPVYFFAARHKAMEIF